MRKEVEATALVQNFFPTELRRSLITSDNALEYLTSPPPAGRTTRFEQIVGYLKPSEVKILDNGKILFDVSDDKAPWLE